jgi:predicted nucleic acid-binding protein
VRRFLFDTSVFLYALGGEHRYRKPCQEILREARDGGLSGEASIELIHEFAYVRQRRVGARADVAHWARRIGRSCPMHAVERADIERALDLWCEHERLDMRDAIFAAQALNRDIDAILSPDRGFDGIPDLERIDPADAIAVASLKTR